jgi:hypothetical protein
MPELQDVLGRAQQPLTAGRFEVASTSPFEVYIDGGIDAIDADAIDGLSYSVGGTGTYLLIQGQRPLCIPTA